MKSIQRHLTLWLLVGVLVLASAGGIGVYLLAQDELVESFDRTLLAKARMVTGWVSQDDHGRLHLDDSDQIEEFGARHDAGYFEIWSGDPKPLPLLRSPSLTGRDLPPWASSRAISQQNLPRLDESALRAIQLTFQP